MNSLLFRLAVVAGFLLLSLPVSAQTVSSAAVSHAANGRPHLGDPTSEKKIEALLKKITLEEKVGQLVQ